jgi:hypothetical protein
MSSQNHAPSSHPLLSLSPSSPPLLNHYKLQNSSWARFDLLIAKHLHARGKRHRLSRPRRCAPWWLPSPLRCAPWQRPS